MNGPQLDCTGPMSRRQFLKFGALAGATGLLPFKLRGQTRADEPDTSVIFVWLPGGPPHMETYDLKPDAPAEYRGEFRPIRTVVPGMDICEYLPMHAQIADKFTLIRSVAHNFSDHGGGHKKFLTGRDPMLPFGFINDYPMVGSMVAKVRENIRRGIPNYIAGVDRGDIDVFSFGSAYLGRSTHPFMFHGDPSRPDFRVRNLAPSGTSQENFNERIQLLESLDRAPSEIDRTGNMAAIGTYRERSLELLASDAARQAFDLSREPLRLRERYGMHVWGQKAILARRLVEHGASFVTMTMENPYVSGIQMPSDGVYNWDSHAVNCHIFNDTRRRLAYYDRAITALVQDLHDRGLDRKVLLIVTGEFGRTPRITYSNGRPGRDHWPQAMSILVSGGGLRMGQVIGSTNSRGEHPREQPLVPSDLWATMFRHLGIDYVNTSFLDHTGRPMPILNEGAPIGGL